MCSLLLYDLRHSRIIYSYVCKYIPRIVLFLEYCNFFCRALMLAMVHCCAVNVQLLIEIR